MPYAPEPDDDLRPNPVEETGTAEPFPLLFGSDGLHAPWSLIVCLVLAWLFSSMAGSAVGAMHLQGYFLNSPAGQAQTNPIAPRPAFLNESLALLVVIAATWVMSAIERRRVGVYGLSMRRVVPRFLAGLGWGVVFLSLLVAILYAGGLIVFDARLLFAGSILRDGAIWLVCFFVVGLYEEYHFRGFVQFTLARGFSAIYRRIAGPRHANALGFWTSALVLALWFAHGHSGNPGESRVGLLATGIVALIFSLSLWRSGSLWWAVGFHTAWDWAQSFLYGVGDSGLFIQHRLFAAHATGRVLLSGGATGPEGSVFVLPIMVLTAVAVLFTVPRTRSGDVLL